MNDNFVFFYGGPFSQWYPSKFIIDGIEYNCAEQYMMAMKALLFGDRDIHSKIMASKNPKEQKAFGREVKNFNADKWNTICKTVVYEGSYAKFHKDPLKKVLLATGNREIVEASPYDKIWGIGLGENDPLRFDKAKWSGTNWLGEALMRVREDLRKQ